MNRDFREHLPVQCDPGLLDALHEPAVGDVVQAAGGGFVWLAGFFAITGTPPFGTFLSEFTILKAAVDAGRTGVAIAFLVALAAVFIGMCGIVLRMVQGRPVAGAAEIAGREPWLALAPPALLGVLGLALGLYLPPFLEHLLRDAARLFEGLS
jgi:hydrogenase-4 component F